MYLEIVPRNTSSSYCLLSWNLFRGLLRSRKGHEIKEGGGSGERTTSSKLMSRCEPDTLQLFSQRTAWAKVSPSGVKTLKHFPLDRQDQLRDVLSLAGLAIVCLAVRLVSFPLCVPSNHPRYLVGISSGLSANVPRVVSSFSFGRRASICGVLEARPQRKRIFNAQTHASWWFSKDS